MDKIDAALTGRASRFTTNTYSNSTSENQQMGVTIPGPQTQGAVHRMMVFGTYDNSASATNFVMRIKYAGVQITAITINTPASATTFVPWSVEFDLVITTTGVSGTCRGRLFFSHLPSAGAFNGVVVPGTATTVNTTVNQTMEITAQWAAASASNTIRCDAGYYHRVSNF
jgi:hypothetical protein